MYSVFVHKQFIDIHVHIELGYHVIIIQCTWYDVHVSILQYIFVGLHVCTCTVVHILLHS